MRRRSSRRISSVNHASRSSSLPGRASDAFDQPARQLEVIAPSRSGAPPTGANGPKCVMNSVSGCHAPMRARLSRQASRSMSGGGVGGRMNRPACSRTPAVSPTNAMPVSRAEVADVMRRVARRVGDVEIAAAGGEPLAAAQDRRGSRPAPGASRPTADPSRRPTAASRSRSASTDRPCAARPSRARRRAAPGSRARACRSRRRDRGGCASAGWRARRRARCPRARARRAAPAACSTARDR